MISGPGSHGRVFNHSNICWKGSMVVCKQSKSFLESTEDSLFAKKVSGVQILLQCATPPELSS